MKKHTQILALLALTAGSCLYSQAQTLPGLVSWWQGESNVLDSVGTNIGSVYVPPPVLPGVQYVAGLDGQAFKFNGGKVTVPSNASLMPANVTVQVWVKGTAIPAFRYILSKSGGAGAMQYALYTGDSGTARFFVFAGGTYVVSPPVPATVWDGNWHQLTAMWDGTGVRIYLDGVDAGFTAGSGSIDYTTPQPLILGDNTVAGGYPYPGTLDNVKIFSRALPPEDVAATYSDMNAAAGTNGLVSWYKAEGDAKDSWGTNNGNDGNTTPPPPRIMTFGPGKNGTAFYGQNGLARVPNSDTLCPQNLTVKAWVKSVGPGSFRYIVGKGLGTANLSYALYTEDGGGLDFYVNITGIGPVKSPALEAGDVWDGEWHLAVGTYDGTTVRLFVDGVEVGTGTPATGTIDYSSPNDLFFGDYRLGGGLSFWGLIDDIQLYDRALTAPEVLDDYTQGKLVSWWKAAGNAEDSIDANDGTLSGTATYGVGRLMLGSFKMGSAGSVQIPDAASLRPNTITLQANVSGTSPGANKYLISKSNNSTDASYGLFTGPSGGLAFYVTVAGGRIVSPAAPSTIWDDSWHDVFGVYDGAKARLYVDGKEIGTGTSGTGNIVYGSYQAGKLIFGDFSETPSGAAFNGMLDDVKIYNVALSAKEVSDNTFLPVLIVTPPQNQTVITNQPVTLSVAARGPGQLTYQWQKDGTNIAGATKSSLVLTNPPLGAYSVVVSAGKALYTSGVVGLAYNAAAGGPARIPNSPDFYTNTSFTIQAWAKGSAVGNFKYLVSKSRHASFYSASYGFYTADNGGLKFFVILDGTTYAFINAGTNAAVWDDNWHQFTGTWDGNLATLYVDGHQADQMDSFGGGDITYTTNYLNGDLLIGDVASTAGGYHFPGVIDEVKFYSRALTGDEIAAAFSSPTTESAGDALVSFWKLEGNVADQQGKHDGYMFPPAESLLSSAALLTVQATPPTLSNPHISSGSFQATVSGDAGSNYVVYRSADLSNWTPFTTNAAPFTFSDPISAGGKFYRARIQ